MGTIRGMRLPSFVMFYWVSMRIFVFVKERHFCHAKSKFHVSVHRL